MPIEGATPDKLPLLVIASRNGDVLAKEEFASELLRHAHEFFGHRLRERELIHELAQEAIENILRNEHKIEKPESIHAYIHTHFQHHWFRYLRKKVRNREFSSHDIDELFAEDAPMNGAPTGEDGQFSQMYDTAGEFDMVSILQEVPKVFRDPVMLRFYGDKSYGEISEILGISQENARQRVSRGISILRSIIVSKNI